MSRCHGSARFLCPRMIWPMLHSSNGFAAIVAILTVLVVLTVAVFGALGRRLLSTKRASWLLMLIGVVAVTLFAVLIRHIH